ncbi:YD repeat-containing protein [Desulfovibrio mangrovi]|uniref:RHS repeat domain-containing protein n=1 Tax=Desulfovibrio mangrovi TaxID=2976983 RepID=UPI00224508AE|nr:RHS repeat domain-containing protein [Desulfovibrio mangrovi]UZP66863.1 YD repeat-containing protein [Desulfovibrio mangrovi]
MHTTRQNQVQAFRGNPAVLMSGGQTGQRGGWQTAGWEVGNWADQRRACATPPQCGPSVRLTMGENGKLREKLETMGGMSCHYAYAYDADGRLVSVHRNGRLTESYQYNGAGQRVRDRLAWGGGERRFVYGSDGRLLSAGDVRFYYDAAGALRCRQRGRKNLYCFYGNDTRLDSVRLPDGSQVDYRYGTALGPVASFLTGESSESFVWLDAIRLATYHDHIRGLSYHFHYGAGRLPEAVTLVDSHAGTVMGRGTSEAATYQLGYDQVGSLRAVWSQSG